MPRLAWFSPMRPARTGVAVYSEEVIAALRREHEIDVYVDEPIAAAYRQTDSSCVRSAHDFIWRHQLDPYDLTVFQLGNSSAHDYEWAYLFRYPGLVVLHDVHLHHARASALLRLRRSDDYRAEFAACHPDADAEAAELAVAGFDSHLYYRWPMTKLVTDGSRMTAVHSRRMAEALRRDLGDGAVDAIRMAHGRRVSEDAANEAAQRVRARHRIPAEAVVFGVFGGLTPEKRVPQVLSAFAGLLPYAPDARLLLAGEPVPHCDVEALARDLGIQERVVITGYVPDERVFDDYVAGCDVSINLRWPTAREVSGPWIRALGAAKPTIIMDLAHTADVPALDPRTWTVVHAPAPPERHEPITISIDIVDEDHSLRLAMRRLAADPDLRTRLGRAAAAYWDREHSMDGMLDDYRRVLDRAMRAPLPKADLPPHVRADASERLDELIEPFGVGGEVWSKI